MASSARLYFLLCLLTFILSSTHIQARESQFFNKIPSNNNNANLKDVQVAPNKEDEPLNNPEQEERNFVQENENGGYGLYDRATTATDHPKYLPKNYNTQAYVTEPEGYKSAQDNNNGNNFYNGNENNNYDNQQQGHANNGVSDNNNNYNGDENNNYYNQQQGYNNNGANYNNNNYDTRFSQQGHTTTGANNYNYYNGQQQGNGYATADANNYNYYNGDNSFNNGQQQGLSGTRFSQSSYTTNPAGGNSYNYPNGGNNNGFQKQGMSDTRFLENGKYYYDVNLERNNYNPNSANNYNSYQYQNSATGYQNQNQYQDFQDEDDLP